MKRPRAAITEMGGIDPFIGRLDTLWAREYRQVFPYATLFVLCSMIFVKKDSNENYS